MQVYEMRWRRRKVSSVHAMSICVSCVLRASVRWNIILHRPGSSSLMSRRHRKFHTAFHHFIIVRRLESSPFSPSTLLHTRIVWITDDLWVSFSYSSAGSLFCCRNLHEWERIELWQTKDGRRWQNGSGMENLIWICREFSSWNWSVSLHTSKCETGEQLIADSWDGWFFFQCFIYISTSVESVWWAQKNTSAGVSMGF